MTAVPPLEPHRARDRYAQCDNTCTVDCGACKGSGRPTAVDPLRARLDQLAELRQAAARPCWEQCGCLLGMGEIPSVSDCHQAGLCRMRQRDYERADAYDALLSVVRGAADLRDEAANHGTLHVWSGREIADRLSALLAPLTEGNPTT